MNTETKHTPTPYEYNSTRGVIMAGNKRVAGIAYGSNCMPTNEEHATAAFIVRACNEHAALVAVAEAAARFESLKNDRSVCGDAYHIAADITGKTSIGQNLTLALANLAAIRGGGK